MKSLKPRTDLPKYAEGCLRDLFEHLGVPPLFQRLRQESLTPQENRLIEKANLAEHAHPQEKARVVLNIVAQQRRLSLERAMLDLAHSLDMLGIGRYETLRKAIGEPVQKARHAPEWNAEAGELLSQYDRASSGYYESDQHPVNTGCLSRRKLATTD